MLVFDVGGVSYAVNQFAVDQVLLIKNILPIPGSPPTIAGIMNVNGRVSTFVDLEVLFGCYDTISNQQAVGMLLAQDHADCGLLVRCLPRETLLLAAPPSVPADEIPANATALTKTMMIDILGNHVHVLNTRNFLGLLAGLEETGAAIFETTGEE